MVAVREELERFFFHENPEKHPGMIVIVYSGTQGSRIPGPRWMGVGRITIYAVDKRTAARGRTGALTATINSITYRGSQNKCSGYSRRVPLPISLVPLALVR